MNLRVIEGGGDIVSTLEALLEEARAGTIDALVYGTLKDTKSACGWACKPDLRHGYALLTWLADELHHGMLRDGLE